MAWITTTGNYVKFLRGTPAAWEGLLEKNSDTLYFISETGATKGKLYLGEKLISDGTTNTINSLNDLSDVLISNNIPNNGLLVYDVVSHSWKPQSLSTVFSLIVSTMTGATATTDGTSGLVPVPQAGDQNKFLRGDGTWADPTAAIQTTVNTLVGQDAGQSVREIVTSEITNLVNGAPATFDTLGEIYDWINSHDTIMDVTEATSRLEAVETAVFGNNDDVNGLINDLTSVKNNIISIEGDITDINDSLKWKDLVEE